MKLQVKKRADSKVLVLPKEFCTWFDLHVGDWLDMDDVRKIEKNKFMSDEAQMVTELGFGIAIEIKKIDSGSIIILDNNIDPQLNNRQMWFQ